MLTNNCSLFLVVFVIAVALVSVDKTGLNYVLKLLYVFSPFKNYFTGSFLVFYYLITDL